MAHRKIISVTLAFLILLSTFFSSCANEQSKESPPNAVNEHFLFLFRDTFAVTPEQKALETVSSFLWMCKYGQFGQASKKYADPDRDMMEIPLQDIADYRFSPTFAQIRHHYLASPALVVGAGVITNGGLDMRLLITCTAEGSKIVEIKEIIEPQQSYPKSKWEADSTSTVDRLIYVDFLPETPWEAAEAIIAAHGCEIYEESYPQRGKVLSFTLLVPEGSDEVAKIAGFKAEPLLLRAGDYYWEKKIERMADSDHAPGEMIVGFPAGTPTGTAREILASYGYSGDRIQQSEYMPQWYTVRFRYEGDDRDELVRAIRELLLDKRIEYADPNGLMTMSTPVEGVITVTFNIGVTAVEAEAVIAAHNCRILESFESERLSYRLRVHKGRNEYEVAEEFRAEPTVSGAAQDVLM